MYGCSVGSEIISLSPASMELFHIFPSMDERLIISDPTEHPYIYFYIKPYQNMILIHIENNYDGVIKGSIDGDILSVKQGKEHGLGIRLVKELVEKADGVLQITSDNKIFSVHIMIPDKENNKLL